MFGIILVVTVLTFFLGFRNALFVGFAIPMSMFISFFILQSLGYTMNTMVLFALVMGLGMLVDNGIVIVENVYRLIEKEKIPRIQAAKIGVSEIAFPIIIPSIFLFSSITFLTSSNELIPPEIKKGISNVFANL